MNKCIEVCHKYHNVPNIDTKKDEVKWIWPETFEHLFLDEVHDKMGEKYKGKTFMTICNHCEEPVCVRVCPTKATFKNAQGVVGMDMHRCIGCRNCMAACPYGARSFNFKNPRDYLDEINPTYPTPVSYTHLDVYKRQVPSSEYADGNCSIYRAGLCDSGRCV